MQDVVPVPIDGHGLLDLVGTGGDGAHTVNVSTMAAIVAAGSGAKVLKHGGRSASSKAGAADVLEALGLPLDLSPQGIAQCVRDVGIGFTLASRFVPGLRHASPVRKALGVPTAINYIAPLTNPAAPSHSLVGCASMAAAPTLARVLAAERRRRATPAGSRKLPCRDQAVLALRWFRDRTRVEAPGRDHGISRATAYRYLAAPERAISTSASSRSPSTLRRSALAASRAAPRPGKE